MSFEKPFLTYPKGRGRWPRLRQNGSFLRNIILTNELSTCAPDIFLLNRHSRMWTSTVALCFFIPMAFVARADILFNAQLENEKLVVDLAKGSNFSVSDSNVSIIANDPNEITEILQSIEKCTSTIQGWDKAKFLREYNNARVDVNLIATQILKRSANFLSGTHPQVNLSAFPAGGDQLPDNVKKFIAEAKQRGIPLTIVQMQGIPGDYISDPDILKDSGLISTDDIRTAVTSYFSEALPRLYDWLRDTPTACYSPEQVDFLKSGFKNIFGSGRGISAHYTNVNLIELECGTDKTYSRFKVPASELQSVVLDARTKGPWPFGPAGRYFSRSWFLKNAIWQMCARESGKYRDNLTVDVADYYCGPP